MSKLYEDNIFILRPVGVAYCMVKGQKHIRNHVYLVYIKILQQIEHRCHDEECVTRSRLRGWARITFRKMVFRQERIKASLIQLTCKLADLSDLSVKVVCHK